MKHACERQYSGPRLKIIIHLFVCVCVNINVYLGLPLDIRGKPIVLVHFSGQQASGKMPLPMKLSWQPKLEHFEGIWRQKDFKKT